MITLSDEVETVIHSDNDFATVAYLRIKKASLQEKEQGYEFIPIPPLLSDEFAEIEKRISTMVEDMEKRQPLERFERAVVNTTAIVPPSYCVMGKWVAFSNIQTPAKSPDIPIADEVVACFTVLTGSYLLQSFPLLTLNLLSLDLLAKCDLSLSHLVFVNIFISDMTLFTVVNSIYKNFFGVSPPARACVASNLPDGLRLRLDCIAYTERSPSERRALHVQSFSYWAPANIGPYSQAIVVRLMSYSKAMVDSSNLKAGNHVFVSGQIGMQPSNLALPNPPRFSLEMALSFQHAHRILSAMSAMYGSNEWRTKVHCAICWLVEDTYVPVVQKLAEILPEASIATLTVLKCLTFPQYSTVPALTLGAESLPKGAQIETQIIAHSGTYTVVDDGEVETRKCTPCFISGT